METAHGTRQNVNGGKLENNILVQGIDLSYAILPSSMTLESGELFTKGAVVGLFHKGHETPSVALAEGAKDTESPSQVVPFCAHGKKLKVRKLLI
jgi:hypothetical protein